MDEIDWWYFGASTQLAGTHRMITTDFKELTKEEALEKLEHIFNKTRISHGFHIPYQIVAALLGKPQVMRGYDGRYMFKESTE